MDFLQIDGKEIPLLEPPESHKETPRRLLHVVFKYKRLILSMFLSISLSVLAVILIMPKQYRASAKVFIKPGRAYSRFNTGAKWGLLYYVSLSRGIELRDSSHQKSGSR